MSEKVKYNEDSIKSLDWKDHIRLRPGMYIGKLGDGSSPDDGIYILLKEVIDNSIDEFVMGNGRSIEVQIKDGTVRIRDYGRGIPLGKVIDCVSKINTGAKYDSEAFKKSVGLNGVGTKAVNALASWFRVQSVREGKSKVAEFKRGELTLDDKIKSTDENDGTIISFIPDETVFVNYHYVNEYVEKMLWNYAYLNTGLTLWYNGNKIKSDNGLLDLLQKNLSGPIVYPIIHLRGNDIELAMTHSDQQYVEDYYSFVNGQHTTQGGTHQAAFREAIVKVLREFYKKDYEAVDLRTSI
ncbi:MAG: ATP-binding protein, partial [Bacteroidia bacterium]